MKEDIIRMAREAGLEDGWAGWCQECGCDSDKLTRFAALVAAVERDRICKQIAQLHDALSMASSSKVRARSNP